MSRPGTSTPLAVSLLALPETTPAALFGILEVFSSVGVAWSHLTGEPSDVARIEAKIVARSRSPIPWAFGPAIQPQASIADEEHSDVVIVTDLNLSIDAETIGLWDEEINWARRLHQKGAILCSVCTGSLFLAEAGLLDGKEATTHWSATDIFRRLYPEVRLKPERILCPEGPEHKIITGGGASSWEDLVLYLIARFRGEDEARRITKIFLLGDRSEGQLVFSALGRPRNHEDRIIGQCQAWVAEHYTAPNPVRRMIEVSGLAERTFKRRFKRATGYAPVDYVQAVRIEEAKQLLETTDTATDAIAREIGYEDPTFFRRLFKRRTGVTPGRYRQRFHPIGRPKPTPD